MSINVAMRPLSTNGSPTNGGHARAGDYLLSSNHSAEGNGGIGRDDHFALMNLGDHVGQQDLLNREKTGKFLLVRDLRRVSQFPNEQTPLLHSICRNIKPCLVNVSRDRSLLSRDVCAIVIFRVASLP
jgi:hypothetical protein